MSNIKKYYFEIILILFIPVLYWKYIPVWINEWSNPDSFYAFGFIVIGFIIYLTKTNFEKLKGAPKEKFLPGTGLLLLGLACYIAGYRADVGQFVNLSFPLLISGIILTFYGKRLFVYTLLPVILFALALPILPIYRFTLPLQLISAKLASGIINILGIHSLTEGSTVFIEKYRLEIVAGCSGLRSTSTLFFFSIIISYFLQIKLYKKILLVICSIPLAVLVNSLRISTVGFYTLYNGYAGMQEFHDNLGIFTFILSMGVLIFAAKYIENLEFENKQ